MLVSQVVLQKSLMIILLDCWYSITGVTFWKSSKNFQCQWTKLQGKLLFLGSCRWGD